MARWRKQEEPVSTEIEPGKKYTATEMAAIADAILKEDARSEICRMCNGRGEETGSSEIQNQYPNGTRHALLVEFKEFACKKGHKWFQGEGAVRGIGGDNPILFEEHFQQRRRREIYTSEGVPDPSIVSGIYNRTHPQGRKVNSDEQRQRNGAAFYR